MSTHSLAPGEPFPRIAVVIPILNEAETLGCTLQALASQDYPGTCFEVLIVDGGSIDNWRTVVEPYVGRHMAVRLLNNPRRTIPAAINLALEATDADAILWLSGHCVLSPNYLGAAAGAFQADPSRVTGGRLEVRGEGVRGRLNALILSSPFGTGLSPFRSDRALGQTESVSFGLFRRQALIDVGGLDESLARNQDNDLLARLKKTGTTFWRVGAVATYLAPATFSGLWRRAYLNGLWSVRGHIRGRGGYSWWHFTPMAAVGLGLVLVILSLVGVANAPAILVALTGLYLVLGLVFGGKLVSKRREWWAFPLLPFLFLMHHAIYGLASWTALLRPNPIPARR